MNLNLSLNTFPSTELNSQLITVRRGTAVSSAFHLSPTPFPFTLSCFEGSRLSCSVAARANCQHMVSSSSSRFVL